MAMPVKLPPKMPVAVASDRGSRSQGGAASLSALTRIEGRRLLARPTVLVGAVLSLAAMVQMSWTTAPVLNRDDTAVSGALLVLAAATLLAANAATLRSRRHRTDELLLSMPTPGRVRTLAHLSSVVVVVPLAVLVAAGFWWWRTSTDPVTSPDPFELATGPALLLLGGCLGVMLARWAPSPTVAPIVVVGLLVLEFIVNILTGGIESGGRIKWLAPMVGQQGVAHELLVRPTGWHLAYLIGLVAVLSCAALLRYQADRRALTATGMALAMVVVTAGAQLRPLGTGQQPHELADRLTAAAQENCQESDAITYCAVPGYESWIHDWSASVTPVLAELPPDGRPEQLTIRQDSFGGSVEFLGPDEPANRPDAPTNSEVRPGLWWGRGPGTAAYQFGLALGVAGLAVGLSPDGAITSNGASYCSSAGQARGVVALWLAGQSSDDSARYLRQEVDIRASDTPSPSGNVPAEMFFDGRAGQPLGSHGYGLRDAVAAVQLLDRSSSQVSDLVTDHWDVLTDPDTTIDQAVRLLGIQWVDSSPPAMAPARSDHPSQFGDSPRDYLIPCP